MKKIYRIIEEKRTTGKSKFYIERFSKFLFMKFWIREFHEEELQFKDYKSAKDYLDYLIGDFEIIEHYRTS